MRYNARSFPLLFLSFALVTTIGAQEVKPENAPVATAQTAPPAGIPVVTATVTLETSVTSKNSHEGTPVKALFKHPVTLPDGETLPKGTILLGRILQVSPHSKAKPNGALLLIFNEARPKEGVSLPLAVKIRSLSQSADSENAAIVLPGAKVGGAANSGGEAQRDFELTDHSTMTSNIKQSGLDGIYLQPSPGGSGVVFAAGTDIYLDSGIRMTLLIARAPASTTGQ
jgi:hypothetical protein